MAKESQQPLDTIATPCGKGTTDDLLQTCVTSYDVADFFKTYRRMASPSPKSTSTAQPTSSPTVTHVLDTSSQHGLAHSLTGSHAGLQSVCRSTLAAKAIAADVASFANHFLGEIILDIPAHQVGDISLYDTVVSANPSLQDKRSLVNVKSIQEYVNQRRTRWIPMHIMMADGLARTSHS